MKKLILFGDGQIAAVAWSYFTHDSDYEVVGFTVDRHYLKATTFLGLPVVPFDEVRSRFPPNDHDMFVSVSYQKMNALREEKYNEAKAMGYWFAKFISPKAIVSPDAVVGENTIIMEANVVQPFVKIGNNCILWCGNHIGHHTEIGDHNFLASHVVISGSVKVGTNCFFGVNATVRDNVEIGNRCIIGAGTMILGNTQSDEVYVGPRSHPIHKKSNEIKI